MEELVYYMIATGTRIPTGLEIKKIIITEDEIEELRDDFLKVDEDIINFILNDELDELAQQFCTGTIVTEAQFKQIQEHGK